MEEGFFTGSGPRIRWEVHRVAGARAALVVVHGYGEHAGRYRELAEAVGKAGVEAYLFDLRGHGRSEGSRGWVRRFEDYLDDLDRVVGLARDAGLPVFAFGHSLGGLILLRYAQEGGEVEGAIVSAPYLRLAFAPPAWKRWSARVLRVLAPRLPIPSGMRPKMLTRDEARRAAVHEDPLHFTIATAGWYFEAERAQKETFARAGRIRLPLLGLLPTADPVADPEATAAFWEAVRSEDRRLVRFEGCLHEVLNELPAERTRALDLVRDWIAERLVGGAIRSVES